MTIFEDDELSAGELEAQTFATTARTRADTADAVQVVELGTSGTDECEVLTADGAYIGLVSPLRDGTWWTVGADYDAELVAGPDGVRDLGPTGASTFPTRDAAIAALSAYGPRVHADRHGDAGWRGQNLPA